MPRLRYIDESEKTPQSHAMIESAKRTGAPDPRGRHHDTQRGRQRLGRTLEQGAL
jgi:hypothetical protein